MTERCAYDPERIGPSTPFRIEQPGDASPLARASLPYRALLRDLQYRTARDARAVAAAPRVWSTPRDECAVDRSLFTWLDSGAVVERFSTAPALLPVGKLDEMREYILQAWQTSALEQQVASSSVALFEEPWVRVQVREPEIVFVAEPAMADAFSVSEGLVDAILASRRRTAVDPLLSRVAPDDLHAAAVIEVNAERREVERAATEAILSALAVTAERARALGEREWPLESAGGELHPSFIDPIVEQLRIDSVSANQVASAVALDIHAGTVHGTLVDETAAVGTDAEGRLVLRLNDIDVDPEAWVEPDPNFEAAVPTIWGRRF